MDVGEYIVPVPHVKQVKEAVGFKGFRDDTTCIVIDLQPPEKSSPPLPASPKKQGMGVFKSMFKKKSSEPSSSSEKEYSEPDVVEELVEEGSAFLSERLDTKYPICNMFKLFICAVCQVEMKPGKGVSIHHKDSYSATKADAEALVIKANGVNGLLTCCVRPSGIFGPGDNLFVPSLVNVARAGKSKNILINCSRLEWPNITHCSCLGRLKFGGGASVPLKLKHLYLSTCNVKEIEIGADVKLASFEYDGASLASILHWNKAQLSRLCFDSVWRSVPVSSHALSNLSNDVPEIKTLLLTFGTVQKSMIPKKLPPFNKLEHLVLVFRSKCHPKAS